MLSTTDARWYTREQVQAVLAHADAAKAEKDAPKWDSGVEDRAEPQAEALKRDEPDLKVPPRNAMAGVLLSDWANGKVDISMENSL
jgi:NAD+ diphosphatase